MKKGISLAPIAHFFHRYHLILFVLTVVIGVSVGMFFMNSLLSVTGNDELSSQTPSSFDQETIKRIDKLIVAGDGSANQELVLPPGRVNPFVE